ncbi:hypothetical protein TIFTF001_014567 [Ficus carica]|uniref:Uncharacterized protein n=1 Tax=Ficus carica TaxID=3494 RepID=A0AA88D8A4_FICCA|nr:hypothetical protein TIFTF001_014567 [Ficus carica]
MTSISPTVPQGGGSHENDRDLVRHSSTSDLVAEGRPNPNPLQRRPSLETTTSSGDRNRVAVPMTMGISPEKMKTQSENGDLDSCLQSHSRCQVPFSSLPKKWLY